MLVLPESSRPQFAVALPPSLSSSSNAQNALLWSLGSSFLSSFLAQPFESGKILAQVQYLPRRSFARQGFQRRPSSLKEAKEASLHPQEEEEEEEGEKEVEEISDEEDAQAYFQDLLSQASQLNTTGQVGERRETDADGYVLRRVGGGGGGKGERDEWVMKRGYSGDGPWAMTKRLWNDEGPGAPWKGAFFSFFPSLVTLA